MANFTGNQIRHTYQRLLQLDDFITQNGTGSINLEKVHISGSVYVTGSQVISENLRVLGNVTAQQFIATTVSSSIVYESGSSQFGNSLDDNHIFTGSLNLTGSMNLELDELNLDGIFRHTGSLIHSGTVSVVTTGDIDLTGNITQSGNTLHTGHVSQTGHITQSGNYTHVGNLVQTGDINLTGDYTQSGNILHTGDVQQTGNTTQIGNIERTGNTILTGSLNLDGSQTVTGNLTVQGDVTARSIITQLTQSTVLYRSGSTKFGDTSDDRHEFTGSLGLTGSFTQLGNVDLTGNTTQIGTLVRNGNTTITGSLSHSGSAVTEGTYEVKEGVYGAFFANPQTLEKNVTIPASYNSRIFGPITVAAGKTLTVGANAKLEIIDI